MANHDPQGPKQRTIDDVAAPRTTAAAPTQEPAQPPVTNAAALVTTTPRTPERKSRSGSFIDPEEATESIKEAIARGFHVITPSVSVPALPAGCVVSIVKMVFGNADSHDVGMGKRGLLKTALEQIANAAGISWDVAQSGRIDDGSDSRYCHWRAVGAWMQLDGTVLQFVGDKEMDLREGSGQVEKMRADALKSDLSDQQNEEKFRKQLRETRAHIMAHAQSKAELRAIRKQCCIRSYTLKELELPFIVVRLAFTGKSADKAQQARFEDKIADRMLSGARGLFGPPPSGPTEMRAFGSHHAPPALGAGYDDDDAEPAPPPPPPRLEPARAAPPPQDRPPARSADGPLCTFGKNKGTPLSALEDRDLAWLEDSLVQSSNDPDKARFKSKNDADLRNVRAEMEARLGGAPQTTTTTHPNHDDY